MSLKLLDEILRCGHSNETTPADQLQFVICFAGFLLKRFYLFIYLYIRVRGKRAIHEKSRDHCISFHDQCFAVFSRTTMCVA